MDKFEARAHAKEIQAGISKEEFKTMGQAMLEQLSRLPEYQEAHTVFCFVGAKGEPDTFPILKQIVADHKQLCVPKVTSMSDMAIIAIADYSSLMPGAFGIQEPIAGKVVFSRDIDLAIVPCQAATEQCFRLGHGGGYYDRFMNHYNGKSVLLCPDALVMEDLPVEAHDCPTTLMITESRTIRR